MTSFISLCKLASSTAMLLLLLPAILPDVLFKSILSRSSISTHVYFIYLLRSMKFEDPTDGEDVLTERFKKVYDDLSAGFRNLEDEYR